MLRHSFNLGDTAARIESAVRKVIGQGLRTKDIWSEGTKLVSTKEMGHEIRENLSHA
jgi:3-isopropylmalate dehydrogenase